MTETTFELGTLKPEPNGVPKFGFRTSPEITAIAEAMVSAQAEFGAAIKDSANPAYRSKYADLSACIEATQKALNKHGIAVMQAPQLDGQMVTITTRLQHKSGQWYESDLSLPAVMRDQFTAQSVGSAITYGRRYSLQAVLNLATTDDDGNSASGVGSHEEAQAVGKAKVAKLKEKTAQNGPKAPETLFYTMPEKHSGFFAEFVNIREFGSALDPVAQEGLRQLLKPYTSKITKEGTMLVSSDKLEALLTKLAGDAGITVQELKAARS
jgi:hypothetical protein